MSHQHDKNFKARNFRGDERIQRLQRLNTQTHTHNYPRVSLEFKELQLRQKMTTNEKCLSYAHSTLQAFGSSSTVGHR